MKLNTKPESNVSFFWCYRSQFLHPFSAQGLLLHGHLRTSSGAAEDTDWISPQAHMMPVQQGLLRSTAKANPAGLI